MARALPASILGSDSFSMKSWLQLGSDSFMEPIMGLFDLARAIPAGFCIDDAVEDGDAVVIVVRAQAAGGLCSLCGSPSAAVHSRYDRKLNDLPIGGRRVQLLVATPSTTALNTGENFLSHCFSFRQTTSLPTTITTSV